MTSLTAPAAGLDLAVGTEPTRIRLNPNTNRLFVPNPGSNNVSVIQDGLAPAVIFTVEVGTEPNQARVDTTTDKVFVLNEGSDEVTIIDDDGVFGTTTVGVGDNPGRIRINTGTQRAYVANWDSDDVTVINTATDLFITTIPVGDRPRRLELDTVNNLIYVLNQDSNTVSVIDGGSNSVIATLPVGQLPDELQLNSANGSFYVANVTSGTVSVIADVTTPPFPNESLKDSWGFSAGALSLPILEVGIMTFDGSGGCIITSTLNTSGTVTGPRNSETCTNSMSPNGTGSIAVQFSDDVFPVLLAFSILEGLGKKRDVATAQRDCLH